MTGPLLTHPTVPRRIIAHTFELAIALVFLITSISYLIDPDRSLLMSPVGRDLPIYVWLSWSMFEAIGSLAMIYGLLALRPNYRVAGLIMLATGTAVHGIAALASGVELRDFNYLIFSATCALRAVVATRFALEGT